MMIRKLIDCMKNLPDTALTDALIASYEDHDEYHLDTIWYHLYQMESLIGSDDRFCNLFNVARVVLVTPHSNAGIECVYSLVKKNKREGSDRNKLDILAGKTILAGKWTNQNLFPSVLTLNTAKYNDSHSSLHLKNNN